MKIIALENGPLLISGSADELLPLVKDGKSMGSLRSFALCRCGQSGNKPFCDGKHKDAGFEAAQVELESEAAGCCVD